MGVPEDGISLRPHHVQRLFYDWQGEDFMGLLSKVRDNGIPRYDESALRQIKAVYDALFFNNAPFAVTPEVDDICRKCNVLKKNKVECICPDDTSFNMDFQTIFRVDFERSYDVRFYGTTAQLKYEPTIRYMPMDVVGQGIQGLRQVIAYEMSYPEQLQRGRFIEGIADKILALEATYEDLRRRHDSA